MIKQNSDFTIISIYSTDVYIKGMHDVASVVSILKKIPSVLFSKAHRIYIHNGKNFDGFDSTYIHGIIEIDTESIQGDYKKLSKLIVHELFHSIEQEIMDPAHPYFNLYKNTEREYSNKKQILLSMLDNDPSVKQKPHVKYSSTIQYSKEFDDYLLNVITYPILQFKINNLFASPYSITSISEYIAVGMEVFLYENREWLRAKCPELFSLIERILYGK